MNITYFFDDTYIRAYLNNDTPIIVIQVEYLPLPVEWPPCFLVGVSFLLALLEDATSDEDDMALALKRGLCPESLLVPD